MENIEFVIAIVVIIMIAFVGHAVFVSYPADLEKERTTIKDMGYDLEDVETYCKFIDCTYRDFIESKSLRKQYELYANGTNSDFNKQAAINEKIDDAESSARASGMAMVMSLGLLMNSGR
jgi:hypothetical protein